MDRPGSPGGRLPKHAGNRCHLRRPGGADSDQGKGAAAGRALYSPGRLHYLLPVSLEFPIQDLAEKNKREIGL